ncbi:MAG: hypothetical protein WCA10_01565 [Terracidiphilus sp.]
MVDDDNINGRLCRFELEAQLILKSGEDGWAGVRLIVGRPREVDVVKPRKPGLVDNDTVNGTAETKNQTTNLASMERELSLACV